MRLFNAGIYTSNFDKLGSVYARLTDTERLKRDIGRPATVIASGGLATLFDKHTKVFDAIEPDLTIQGLSLLYQRVVSA